MMSIKFSAIGRSASGGQVSKEKGKRI